MRTRTTISFALLLAAVASTGCGSSPEEGASTSDALNFPPIFIPTSTIKVTDTSTGTTVFSKGLYAYGTHAFGLSELGTTLANRSLGLQHTKIDFSSDNRNAELLAFARDPAEHTSTTWNMFGNLYNQGYLANHTYLFAWDANVAEAPWSSNVGLPNALSLVYPSHNALCLSQPCVPPPAEFNGNSFAFWDAANSSVAAVPASSVPGLSAPSGQGSLHALAVVDHGQCSQEVTWESIGSQILDQTWQQVKTQAYAAGWPVDFPQQNFAGASSYLDHAVGTESSWTGGLIAAMRYVIFLDSPFGSKNMDLTAQWQFKLTNGILDASNIGYWNTPDTYDAGTLQSAMQTQVPQTIHAQAVAKQVAPVPVISGYAKTLSGTKQMLKDVIDVGASNFGLSASDITSLKASIDNNANWTNFNSAGACLTVPGTTNQQCEFIVRASRLNVLPDAAELVFFDGKEPTNPTYALYVAMAIADKLQSTNTVAQLCGHHSFGTFDWHPDSADWTTRRYYYETRTTTK